MKRETYSMICPQFGITPPTEKQIAESMRLHLLGQDPIVRYLTIGKTVGLIPVPQIVNWLHSGAEVRFAWSVGSSYQYRYIDALNYPKLITHIQKVMLNPREVQRRWTMHKYGNDKTKTPCPYWTPKNCEESLPRQFSRPV